MARWRQVDNDTYKITWNSKVWYLSAVTDKPKRGHRKPKPWVLYMQRDEAGRAVRVDEQEISADSPEYAKHRAEVCLDMAKFCIL